MMLGPGDTGTETQSGHRGTRTNNRPWVAGGEMVRVQEAAGGRGGEQSKTQEGRRRGHWGRACWRKHRVKACERSRHEILILLHGL